MSYTPPGSTSSGGSGAGPQGPPGPAGQGFTARGIWSATATYAPYDVVTRLGSSYAALNPRAAGQPAPETDSSNWLQMAAKGDAGPVGSTGPAGPIGPTGPTGAAAASPQRIPSTTGAISTYVASLGYARQLLNPWSSTQQVYQVNLTQHLILDIPGSNDDGAYAPAPILETGLTDVSPHRIRIYFVQDSAGGHKVKITPSPGVFTLNTAPRGVTFLELEWLSFTTGWTIVSSHTIDPYLTLVSASDNTIPLADLTYVLRGNGANTIAALKRELFYLSARSATALHTQNTMGYVSDKTDSADADGFNVVADNCSFAPPFESWGGLPASGITNMGIHPNWVARAIQSLFQDASGQANITTAIANYNYSSSTPFIALHELQHCLDGALYPTGVVDNTGAPGLTSSGTQALRLSDVAEIQNFLTTNLINNPNASNYARTNLLEAFAELNSCYQFFQATSNIQPLAKLFNFTTPDVNTANAWCTGLGTKYKTA